MGRIPELYPPRDRVIVVLRVKQRGSRARDLLPWLRRLITTADCQAHGSRLNCAAAAAKTVTYAKRAPAPVLPELTAGSSVRHACVHRSDIRRVAPRVEVSR